MRRSALSVFVGISVAAMAVLGSAGAAVAAPAAYYDDQTIPLSGSSRDVAVAPDGTIYATSGANIAVLTPSSGGAYSMQTLSFGGNPIGVAVSADGGTLAISDATDNRVRLVSRSGGSYSLGQTLSSLSGPQGLIFTADGTLLVADPPAGEIKAFANAASNSAISALPSISVPPLPRWLTIAQDGSLLVTHQSNPSSVTVLRDAGTGYSVFGTVPVTGAPYGIDAADDGSVLVVSFGSGAVGILTRLELTGSTWAVAATYSIADWSYGIATMPGGRAAITTIVPDEVHIWSRQLEITTANLGSLTAGTSTSQTLAAAGGSGSRTWSVSAGTLPTGMTLAANGVLSGSPASAGAYSFTVLATDAANSANTASAVFSGSIAPAAATPGNGPQSVTVTNQQSAPQAAASLPDTGAPVESLGGLALGIGATGLLLVLAARRRAMSSRAR